MPIQNHAFPWGIYIGDLIDNNDNMPLCLDSKQGGFCVLFDDESEVTANTFIENVALKLFEVLPMGDMLVDIFDFSHKKRFMHLSSLQSQKLYNIAFNQNNATTKFNKIEEIALERHHNTLSFETPTISEYNQKSKFKEQYHLLLINLDSFPDETTSKKRIKNFFDSAYEAGFYTIAFGSQDILESEVNATQVILNQFVHLSIKNNTFKFTKELIEFADIIKKYDFEYVNDNKDKIIQSLLAQLEKEENNSGEKDFLSIPIGTSKNGREIINFTMGDKSTNLHAFITGVTGSGKTTLLNNIITGIAQKYSSQEIQLYLMDYKDGVEFQVFKNHPNCKKIFLDNEDLSASISLLEEFRDTMKTRAKFFKEQGVSNITAYNKLNTQKPMPRIILIIDEVHKLFVGDYNYVDKFSSILKPLMRQGRSYGVHIILSTQSLAGTQIDRELMGQITLRISYKLTDPSDSESIFTYGNIEALNLEKYELIYNNNAGNKKDNVLCRVNSPVDINSVLEDVLFMREEALILKPVIVQSEEDREEDVINIKEEKLEVHYESKYSTSLEDENLKKLEAMGIKV
ncbi:MAG: Cell division protein FtsK [uncultured Sulfurovum sp.]|uniref:Cell division protein FtsK n=1 Tax=uncultured Sulfurovum sp. TaxID=269237 RepID=A0A6S6SWP2_9BACT|nr:MAG: Cell division protein FtsK [uncultured Sulfurovum sp.]